MVQAPYKFCDYVVTNCDTYFISWCFIKVLLKNFHACNIIVVVLFVDVKNVRFVNLFVGCLLLVFFTVIEQSILFVPSVAANN
jgi:hypothetical protein